MKKINVIKNQRKKIEQLKWQRTSLNAKLAASEIREKKLQEKLKLAESEIKTVDGPCGPIQVIEADVEIWGGYTELSHSADEKVIKNKQILDEAAKILAGEVARKLIENNVAQVIYKSREEWEEIQGGRKNATLGVKLFVVPWEQMRTGSRIKVMRQMRYED